MGCFSSPLVFNNNDYYSINLPVILLRAKRAINGVDRSNKPPDKIGRLFLRSEILSKSSEKLK